MSSLQGVGYESVSYTRKYYQVVSESINGKVQVRNIGAARWEWDINFPPMTADEFQPLLTFLLAKEGMKNAFQMSLPNPELANTYQTYDVRLADMEQEFDIGVDSLAAMSIKVIEVL